MSTIRIDLVLSPGPGAEEAQLLADAAELVVDDNVRWIQRQRAAGHETACCARCGGIVYRPPSRAEYRKGVVTIAGAQAMFDAGHGACGTIAAYDAAAKRVKGQHAWVEVVPSELGPSYYHAIVGTPDGSHDPTAEMERGASCSCLR